MSELWTGSPKLGHTTLPLLNILLTAGICVCVMIFCLLFTLVPGFSDDPRDLFGYPLRLNHIFCLLLKICSLCFKLLLTNFQENSHDWQAFPDCRRFLGMLLLLFNYLFLFLLVVDNISYINFCSLNCLS